MMTVTRLVRWFRRWRLVSRKQAIKALDDLTDRSNGGARLTIRQYNTVLTDLGFDLNETPEGELPIQCRKCGGCHDFFEDCPPNVEL